MKIRNLEANEIVVHNRPGRRCIVFNPTISKALQGNEIKFVIPSRQRLGFGKHSYQNKEQGKVSYSNNSAVAYGKNLVESVCNHLLVPQGDYYMKVAFYNGEGYAYMEILEVVDREPYQKPTRPSEGHKVCAKCGRDLPLTEYYRKGRGYQSWCKDCCRDHGRLRNGSTGEYRENPTLTQATDQQLYDELKRRGYEGKLSITKTLE